MAASNGDNLPSKERKPAILHAPLLRILLNVVFLRRLRVTTRNSSLRKRVWRKANGEPIHGKEQIIADHCQQEEAGALLACCSDIDRMFVLRSQDDFDAMGGRRVQRHFQRRSAGDWRAGTSLVRVPVVKLCETGRTAKCNLYRRQYRQPTNNG